jgi:hypothetical protein
MVQRLHAGVAALSTMDATVRSSRGGAGADASSDLRQKLRSGTVASPGSALVASGMRLPEDPTARRMGPFAYLAVRRTWLTH